MDPGYSWFSPCFEQSELFSFTEDTYSKPEVVDGQEVTINVMDTYDRVSKDRKDFHFPTLSARECEWY
jgi:hypothetical protein